MDIDPQAVEVTKLSLLLKVLEGESGETLTNQLRLFHERALPDLGGNIKCGNSLIGPDFYNGQQMSLLDDEERYRINVFDWQAEFPAVFKGSRRVRRGDRQPAVYPDGAFKRTEVLPSSHYVSHDERSDLYVLLHRTRICSCCAGRRRFGMIVSNKFLRANYGAPLPVAYFPETPEFVFWRTLPAHASSLVPRFER